MISGSVWPAFSIFKDYVPQTGPSSASPSINLEEIFKGFMGDEIDHAGLYLSSNESFRQETVAHLRSLPSMGNTLIGVSTFFNFELFLARADKGVKYFISIDPDKRYGPFWKKVAEFLANSDSKESFVDKLTKHLYDNITDQPSDHYGIIINDYRRFIPYLKTDLFSILNGRNFTVIKALFAEKRFAYAPIDLGKLGSGNRLGQILQSHQLTIDTAYVSNVWLHLKDQVQTLPDRSASEMDFEMQEDVESGAPYLKNYLKNIHSFKASLTQSINIIYATRVHEGSPWQLQELGQVISDGGQYPRNFIYARPATE